MTSEIDAWLQHSLEPTFFRHVTLWSEATNLSYIADLRRKSRYHATSAEIIGRWSNGVLETPTSSWSNFFHFHAAFGKNLAKTRKHSIRMLTARLLTVGEGCLGVCVCVCVCVSRGACPRGCAHPQTQRHIPKTQWNNPPPGTQRHTPNPDPGEEVDTPLDRQTPVSNNRFWLQTHELVPAPFIKMEHEWGVVWWESPREIDGFEIWHG